MTFTSGHALDFGYVIAKTLEGSLVNHLHELRHVAILYGIHGVHVARCRCHASIHAIQSLHDPDPELWLSRIVALVSCFDVFVSQDFEKVMQTLPKDGLCLDYLNTRRDICVCVCNDLMVILQI